MGLAGRMLGRSFGAWPEPRDGPDSSSGPDFLQGNRSTIVSVVLYFLFY
jgi:hypothetical protein